MPKVDTVAILSIIDGLIFMLFFFTRVRHRDLPMVPFACHPTLDRLAHSVVASNVVHVDAYKFDKSCNNKTVPKRPQQGQSMARPVPNHCWYRFHYLSLAPVPASKGRLLQWGDNNSGMVWVPSMIDLATIDPCQIKCASFPKIARDAVLLLLLLPNGMVPCLSW